MGNELSEEELEEKKQEVAEELYDNLENASSILPDIGIDAALWKYSGLDSAAQLKEAYSKTLRSRAWQLKAADMVKDWGRRLAPLTPFPFAVGLGALVIAMVIEKKMGKEEEEEEDSESPMRLLQRVFAEEKEKEVQDLMEEYLKRHQMHLFDERKLQGELQHWERLLSAQLTRLKTSMLRDGHMSTRTLKIWVNGAAFHTQMLIHLARLERGDPTPARGAIAAYQEALQDLLRKYKEFKATTIKIDNSPLALVRHCQSYDFTDEDCSKSEATFLSTLMVVPIALTGKAGDEGRPYRIIDSELKREDITCTEEPLPKGVNLSDVVGAFLDHMIENHDDFTEMREYFSNLETDLEKLVALRGDFTLPPPSAEAWDLPCGSRS